MLYLFPFFCLFWTGLGKSPTDILPGQSKTDRAHHHHVLHDNRGYYSGRAGQGAERGERPDLNPESYSGRIAWRSAADPITGVPAPNVWNQNITHSALTKYLGHKTLAHSTPQQANEINKWMRSIDALRIIWVNGLLLR